MHAQHAPQLPHTAAPLGPEMARGAFEARLPLAPLFGALHAVPLRELVTHCLSSPQHCLLHLVGLSILGGATAGARELHDDPNALNFAHYEYFGRPFAVAASLHQEHQPLLDELLLPSYAQRYGKEMGTLVQKSFIRDVSPQRGARAARAPRWSRARHPAPGARRCARGAPRAPPTHARRRRGTLGARQVVIPDLACIACNAERKVNRWVTDRLKRLHQESQFEDVRALANDVRQAFYSMGKTGVQNANGEPVANKETMRELYDDLLHGV